MAIYHSAWMFGIGRPPTSFTLLPGHASSTVCLGPPVRSKHHSKQTLTKTSFVFFASCCYILVFDTRKTKPVEGYTRGRNKSLRFTPARSHR